MTNHKDTDQNESPKKSKIASISGAKIQSDNSDYHMDRLATAFESSAHRWELIVYPSLFAFILLAGYGFFLIYSLTTDIATMSRNLSQMTTVIEQMTSDVGKISSKMNNLTPMRTSMDSMSTDIRSMTLSTYGMNRDIHYMGREIGLMNQNIGRMSNVMPW